MRRRAERLGLGVAVLVLHLLLLWAWQRVLPPPARERGHARPTRTLTVLPITRMLPVLPAADPPPRVQPPEPAAPSTGGRDAPRPRATAPNAITTPADAPAPAPTVAPNASASEAPRLDLALPRDDAAPVPRSMRDQMLDDPRANSPRPSVESRVAAVTGTTDWTEERVDATRTRFRKNGRCIEVHVARNAQIDPWNQNHSPTPKAVKPEC